MEVLDLQGGEDALRAQLPETGQSGTLRVLDLSSSCPDAFFMLVRTSSAAPSQKEAWYQLAGSRFASPVRATAQAGREHVARCARRRDRPTASRTLRPIHQPGDWLSPPSFLWGGGGSTKFRPLPGTLLQGGGLESGLLGAELVKKVGCIEEAVKAIHSVREERLGDDLEAAKRKSFKGLSETT